MALLKFNNGSGANAMERTGIASGMFLGKVMNSIEHGMNAFADPKNFQSHAMKAAHALVQKVEAKPTMPFVNLNEGFGSTFSKAAAATRQGYTAAREMKPDKVLKNNGPKGMAPT